MEDQRSIRTTTSVSGDPASVTRESIALAEEATRLEFLAEVARARELQLKLYGSDLATGKTRQWLVAILLKEIAEVAERVAVSDVSESDEQIMDGLYEALVRTGAVTAALYEWHRVGLDLGLVHVEYVPHTVDPWHPEA